MLKLTTIIQSLTIVTLSIALPATAQLEFPDGSSLSTASDLGTAPADHGGTGNSITGDSSFIGGGAGNTIYDDFCTIAGGIGNTAGLDDEFNTWYATIGGGYQNTANAFAATVPGGYNNSANGNSSTVSGGNINRASGASSTVSGGYSNSASQNFSTVSGGNTNIASGSASTIPGGDNNTCRGNSSFVAGREGNDLGHNYSFVWAGNAGARTSAGADTFNVWSAGGIYLNGAVMHSSDRNLKEGFTPINAQDVLNKVVDLPITTWRFKSEDDTVSHIGPVAQDFMTAFGYGGDDNKHITATDADGVALAAIQGLNQKLNDTLADKQREIDALNKRLTTYDTHFKALEKRVLAMETSSS